MKTLKSLFLTLTLSTATTSAIYAVQPAIEQQK